jgi:hypothetical protein
MLIHIVIWICAGLICLMWWLYREVDRIERKLRKLERQAEYARPKWGESDAG